MTSNLGFSFDHVHFFCSDLTASVRWFMDGLGAELVRERSVSGARAADLRLAGTSLFLREQTAGEKLGAAGPSRFGTAHMGLRVDDLICTIEELRRRGVEIEMEPKEMNPGLKIAFIRGPDSVRVEVLERK